MLPREAKGRQLVAELADFLNEGKYSAEAHQALAEVIKEMRVRDFAGQVDGKGDIQVPLASFLTMRVTEKGIGIRAKEG